MIKVALIQIAVTAVVYFIGVFVGMGVAKQHFAQEVADADIEPIAEEPTFDEELIQHVGYDEEQCARNK